MHKAFVAGATGYTGRAVVKTLRAKGIETVAHVRPGSSGRAESQRAFEALGATVDATPWEPEAMTATLAAHEATLVFALLGTTRRRGKEAAKRGLHETYETIDYGLSALLLGAASQSPHQPKYIYLSSMGVSAGTRNQYLAVRYRLEEELKASGLPYVIARPSFITGDDRTEARPGERVGAAVADTLLGIAGAFGAKSLEAKYQSQTAADLAAALVTLALDERPRIVAESDVLRRLVD